MQHDLARCLRRRPGAHAAQAGKPDVMNVLAAGAFLARLGAVQPLARCHAGVLVEMQVFQIVKLRRSINRKGRRGGRRNLPRVLGAIAARVLLHLKRALADPIIEAFGTALKVFVHAAFTRPALRRADAGFVGLPISIKIGDEVVGRMRAYFGKGRHHGRKIPQVVVAGDKPFLAAS